MIARSTTINFSDLQHEVLVAYAKRQGIKNPTTPGVVGSLIADLPEFKELSTSNADNSSDPSQKREYRNNEKSQAENNPEAA